MKHFESIDDLENNLDNHLVSTAFGECFDEDDSEKLICPWCGAELELEAEELWNLEELNNYKLECPECDQMIYFRAEPSVNLYSKRDSDNPEDAIEIY